jgi:hypothetical protein
LSARSTGRLAHVAIEGAATCATLSRTSCTAAFASTCSWNSATTFENPSRENERIVFTPWIVLIASSMRRVISSSTTSAEAPG